MALGRLLMVLAVTCSQSLTLRGGNVRRSSVTMRDTSAVYWFKAGDRVRVTESVLRGKEDLLGRTGVVTDTWEKCEVDPHCCCAELAEENSAVHVSFASASGDFEYYFSEDELAKVKAPSVGGVAAVVSAATTVSAAAAAQDLEPLLTSEPRRDVAVALVAPLLAYKLAAMANRQKLMLPLDVSIALAGAAAVYYCLP